MLHRTFNMTDGVHMGIAVYKELDDMMPVIICITAASQTLLLIYTCCFPFIAIVHLLFHYMLCF